MKNRCKNCKFFERAYTHPVYSKNKEKEPQYGGYCNLLLKVLQIDNASLCHLERIYIQDSFGCILFREIDTQKE